jgi:hypothetical protein
VPPVTAGHRIKAWLDLKSGDNTTANDINLPYDAAGTGNIGSPSDGLALQSNLGATDHSQLVYNEITGEVYIPTTDGYSK